MTTEQCLPAELRGPDTTITPIAAGMSGAGVYRVEAGGQVFVLKVAPEHEDAADWRRAVQIQRAAAEAGLSPRVVHIDEERRAVVTSFVVDRSFVAIYLDPATHEGALTQLGRTVRRIHALDIPADAVPRDPRAFLARVWQGLRADFALPDFAAEAVERVLAEAPPAQDRPLVLGHNDLNPSNLVHDGQAILMLDWATAGPMDPLYDLAALALFLRMDQGTCLRLLSAYDGTPVVEVPGRFLYTRRLVAALVGTLQLYLAHRMKHPGATGTETRAATLPLREFYQQLRAGVIKLGTAEGQWAFGLTMLAESLAL
jgi:aminoglycoside phosphotransferase (APT) family kinase protein